MDAQLQVGFPLSAVPVGNSRLSTSADNRCLNFANLSANQPSIRQRKMGDHSARKGRYSAETTSPSKFTTKLMRRRIAARHTHPSAPPCDRCARFSLRASLGALPFSVADERGTGALCGDGRARPLRFVAQRWAQGRPTSRHSNLQIKFLWFTVENSLQITVTSAGAATPTCRASRRRPWQCATTERDYCGAEQWRAFVRRR
uniref:Uncharacterized protein n=1 Tax=Trichuris muris TaxID=70415 RepID=A0A5S6R4V2_TRIMR